MMLFRLIYVFVIYLTCLVPVLHAGDYEFTSTRFELHGDMQERLEQELLAGEWDHFLEQIEQEYQQHLAASKQRRHPAATELEIAVDRYEQLLHDTRSAYTTLYTDLCDLLAMHGIDDVFAVANGGGRSDYSDDLLDSAILPMAEEMSVGMIVLAMSFPDSFLYAVELGISPNLPAIYGLWMEEMEEELFEESVDDLDEIDYADDASPNEMIALFDRAAEYGSLLRPTLREYSIKMLLVHQMGMGEEAESILEVEKQRRLSELIRHQLSLIERGCSESELNEMALDILCEFVQQVAIESLISDIYRHNCRYLEALSTGTLKTNNQLEIDFLPYATKQVELYRDIEMRRDELLTLSLQLTDSPIKAD